MYNIIWQSPIDLLCRQTAYWRHVSYIITCTCTCRCSENCLCEGFVELHVSLHRRHWICQQHSLLATRTGPQRQCPSNNCHQCDMFDVLYIQPPAYMRLIKLQIDVLRLSKTHLRTCSCPVLLRLQGHTTEGENVYCTRLPCSDEYMSLFAHVGRSHWAWRMWHLFTCVTFSNGTAAVPTTVNQFT